jgi:hypothetical protein
VGPNGDRQIVSVPQLELAPAEPRPRTAAPEPAPLAPVAAADEAPSWPWLVGGAGVVSLGASVTGLALSQGAASTLEERCGAARNLCPPRYDADADHGQEVAGFAVFVGFGALGLGALATAVIGLALPRDEASSLRTGAWAASSGFGLHVASGL